MKVIACYSNKGGVGKTAAAVNLAHAFAVAGKRVLLCDLDPQGASGFYFRVKPSKKLKSRKFFRDVDRITKSIRASDYENLDILPANMTFRDFDIFLSRMKNTQSRLKKALRAVDNDYDVVVLDCPPNISTLSENVFRAAHAIVVPVVPTTLSQRSFGQLVEFFAEHKLPKNKLHPFFSMVQKQKSLHATTMEEMGKTYKKRFLRTTIPFSSDIEKMGVHRAPVATFAARRPATLAYRELWRELAERL